MAIDTPARIAILGAGPIGLEAALYARFLGYDVDLYERGRACEHVLRWAHAKLFTPFAANASPLGIAALRAQDPDWQPPDADALLTGQDFLKSYLLPLAASDLIEDQLHEQTEVVAVAKTDSLKSELCGEEERGDEDFRLLVRGPNGQERYSEAAIVLDCTGVLGQPNAIGPAGLPALGELALGDRIEHGLPDMLGAERARFANKHTLVIGDGHIAAANILALLKLTERHPDTRVTWLTHPPRNDAGPIAFVADDPFPERNRRARLANDAALQGRVTWQAGAEVYSVATDSPESAITLRTGGEMPLELSVDRVLADVGYRPNASLWSGLQVRLCPATDKPEASAPLFTTEPNFYLLGAKSYGRRADFTLLDGLRQVRDLFKIIGDRETLDLYQSIGGVRL